MAHSQDTSTRGIVQPAAGFQRFHLDRYLPSPDVEWAVDRFWIVRWDLRGEAPYRQRVLPHPAVHLVFESGRAEIQAVSTGEFVRSLDGLGQVFGIKFQPGGFRPFLGRPVSTITGQRLPAASVFGPDVDRVARVVGQAEDLSAMRPVVEEWLRGCGRQPHPMTTSINAIVALISNDRSLTRVDDLAARLHTTTRRLQRLFAEHVGVGPKWVINRCRIHEVVEVAGGSSTVDWAQLAVDLGYSDQSHLVRDFTAAVGSPPGRYADHADQTD